MQIWKEKKENPKNFETKEINQRKKKASKRIKTLDFSATTRISKR